MAANTGMVNQSHAQFLTDFCHDRRYRMPDTPVAGLRDMYESFYGLTGKPFSLLPDAAFLYPSQRHRKVINLLEYSITTETGFMVITGDVGAGKTTAVRHYLKSLPPEVTVGLITNSSKSLGRLLSWVAAAFELDTAERDDSQLYNNFIKFLLKEYAAGRRTVLIIDEAQNLTTDMLEDLRMLSNVNNERDQLLQIILVGQPELREVLNQPELRQLVQRIGVHAHLTPLTAIETAGYIRHRLGVVGGQAGPVQRRGLRCRALLHGRCAPADQPAVRPSPDVWLCRRSSR